MASFDVEVSSAANQLVEPVHSMLEQVLAPVPVARIDEKIFLPRVSETPGWLDYELQGRLSEHIFDIARVLSETRYSHWDQVRAPRRSVNVSDVAAGLADLRHQVEVLRRRSEPCPIAQFEEYWIPVLLSPEYVTPQNIQVLTRGDLSRLVISTVDPSQLPNLMAQPLAQFLAFRIFAASTGVANVEVSTKTAGWQVIYSPPHVLRQNGFGSTLTTPVLGYVPPGNWRFGIKNAGTLKMDSTVWPIPPSLSAPIPHKVPLTL